MHLRVALATLLMTGTTTGAIASGTATSVAEAPTGAQRPNIVVLMTDDMRADDLRFMPTVQRELAARGLTFRNSFSPYPLCCPARTSFFTGQYAHNHGNLGNGGGYGFKHFVDTRSVATSLQDAGYRTALVGKYLNRYGFARHPLSHQRSTHYVPPGWTDWYAATNAPRRTGKEGSVYDYYNTLFNVNGRLDDSHRGTYQTNLIGRFTRKLVTKYAAGTAPFFLYVAPIAPHFGKPVERDDLRYPSPARPAWVRGRFNRQIHSSPGRPRGNVAAERIADKPRVMRHRQLSPRDWEAITALTRQRAEALCVLDREFRKLVRTLKREGVYDDTVVLFTSDNGYFLGEHRIPNGKIRGYEPALRVPLVVAGPGIPAGVRHDPTTTFDLTTTILDLAQAEAPHPPDGRSLVPSFAADQGWTAPVVTEAVLGGRRYKRATQRKARGFLDVRTSIGIRTAGWKLTRYSTGELEVYDLVRDPGELTNLVRDPAYASITQRLLTLWWQYKDCEGAACQAPLPEDLRAWTPTGRPRP